MNNLFFAYIDVKMPLDIYGLEFIFASLLDIVTSGICLLISFVYSPINILSSSSAPSH